MSKTPRGDKFIEDMEAASIPWRWYSGRSMYGAQCPAVDIQPNSDVTGADVWRATKLNGLLNDDMGRGFIIYCRDSSAEPAPGDPS